MHDALCDHAYEQEQGVFYDTGRMTLELEPFLYGTNAVSARAVVTRAQFNGIGQAIADLFRIGLKGLAQDAVNKSLSRSNLHVAIPDDLADSVRLQHVEFIDLGNASLGLAATGTVVVSPATVINLCRRFGVRGCTI